MTYELTKSAIITKSKFLAKEFLASKVRINTIGLGGIFDYQNKKFLMRYGKYCTHKKLLDTYDIVGLVEFLISDASKKITGQDFIIDDGFTL
jgi:NAD(P)-dependent dehydrogenase (short-subunit alcohol dehydrogenase family)